MLRKITALAFGLALLAAPARANAAEMWDVIVSTLADGCSMEKYLKIVSDFNEYYADKGYQAEILVPMHNETVDTVIWVARSPDATSFGKAVDLWEKERMKKGSAIQKLDARFEACGTTTSRSSYLKAG